MFQTGPNIQVSPAAMQSIGLVKLDAIFEEMIKQTWEEAKVEDTPEEQLRKLNEKNYNTRVQNHIKTAISMACYLYSRYSCPIVSEALTL